MKRIIDVRGPILSWDIEIANVFELKDGEDLERYAPFDISVAAAGVGNDPADYDTYYAVGPNGMPASVAGAAACVQLLDDLEAAMNDGHRVFAWNGLGFDWRWLGHNAGDMARAARLALHSYDPCFQMLCTKGFMVGLSAVAAGFAVAGGKTMDGADAPRAWQDGRWQEVIDYVRGDVRLTNAVAECLDRGDGCCWITKRGRASMAPWAISRPVLDCLRFPMPDTSWMDAPKTRDSCLAWMPPPVLEEFGLAVTVE